PDSVTSIGNSAFSRCNNLKSITIPDSVMSIGNSAFYKCTGLTSVTIGSGIETIYGSTFQDCPNLTTIKIKKSLKSIEKDAFKGIKSIPDIFFEGSEEEWKAISIDQSNDMILRANMHYNADLSHEHSYTETVKEATCTEDGLKTFTCSCGRSYTEKIPAVGHNFRSIVVEPTCVSIGYEKSTCQNCGLSYFIREISATGHTKTIVKGKEATCKENGLTEGVKCSVCGEVTVKQEEVKALGHDFVIEVEAKAPTCTESGTTEGKYCTRCDYKVEAEEIPALGHNDTNNDGKCDRCGETLGTHNPSEACSCACHKKGIVNFFFKIGLIFQKMFKKNKICKCGAWHY
ncbi:MAG: leucine-rich repeat domain-containing protein, partial [Clostridia bacterium]|nr:leucine-rich repeat domain-containing protein [Clostridia bacterium]